jgi:hypothetical protein
MLDEYPGMPGKTGIFSRAQSIEKNLPSRVGLGILEVAMGTAMPTNHWLTFLPQHAIVCSPGASSTSN